MFLLNILFDGDILLPTPSWVSYEPQAILGRNKIHWITTKRENNWFPTGEEIEKIILKDRGKKYLLFLNSPNNPSGQVCDNLKEISLIPKKYDILILSDEIYIGGTLVNLKKLDIKINNKINLIKTSRGGKITWHGPGQLICYFVIDLNKRNKDIRKFIFENLKLFHVKGLDLKRSKMGSIIA